MRKRRSLTEIHCLKRSTMWETVFPVSDLRKRQKPWVDCLGAKRSQSVQEAPPPLQNQRERYLLRLTCIHNSMHQRAGFAASLRNRRNDEYHVNSTCSSRWRSGRGLQSLWEWMSWVGRTETRQFSNGDSGKRDFKRFREKEVWNPFETALFCTHLWYEPTRVCAWRSKRGNGRLEEQSSEGVHSRTCEKGRCGWKVEGGGRVKDQR